jgi:nicotinamide riboside transporter PnuC
MPYGYIIIIAVIGLTLYFVFATGASRFSKTLVFGVLGACLLCRFWLHRYSLWALFVMVGLGIFISFYRIYEQARSSGRDG